MPFKQGQAFEIRILALTDIFKIAVNGKHFCDFRHRLALAEVKTLYIKGKDCITLDFIQFEGDQLPGPYTNSPIAGSQQVLYHQNALSPPSAPPPIGFAFAHSANAQHSPTGVAPNFAQPGAPAGSHPQGHTAPIFKPPVPYTLPLPNGLEFRQQVFITGTPKNHAESFSFNFCIKDDVMFHFNPRFKENIVVRNTRRNKKWEKEERSASNFPFLHGGTFDVIILCDVDGFKVAVNGQHYVHYAHRVPPQAIDSMSIDGDVTIQQIHIQ